jgi:Hypothetical protein (DUF2513)
MHRDLDLIRQILLELEQHDHPSCDVKLQCPGYTEDQISYHVKLLAEHGFLEAINLSTLSGFEWRPTSLTWAGHEFLDAARNATVWRKLKVELKDRGISLPMSLIQQLALKIAAKMAGL